MKKFICCSIVILVLIGNHVLALYLLKRPQTDHLMHIYKDGYDFVYTDNNIIAISFEGSGGIVYGGVLPNNKEVNKLLKSAEIVREDMKSYFISTFPQASFPDPLFYYGNYDHDYEIEVFYFDIMGRNFGGPFQINNDGSILKENILLVRYITLPFRFPIIIIYSFVLICLAVFLTKKWNKSGL